MPRRRLRGTWVALALATLLAACAPNPPPLPPLPADAVLLAFGDSLTAGSGVAPPQSYPAVLEQLIGRRVVNAGLAGELSGDGLARLPALLAQWHPDLVLICHGGNNLLQRQDPVALAADLRAMIRSVREHGANAVLIAVPKPGLLLSVPEFYQRIAAEAGVPLEAGALATLEGDRGYKSDAVHLNAAGYRRLAEAIATLLRASGALPR